MTDYCASKNQTGTVVVIVPLISLIQDIYQKSVKLGIKCLQIHSGVGQGHYSLDNLADYKIIFVCPERLGLDENGDNGSWFVE